MLRSGRFGWHRFHVGKNFPFRATLIALPAIAPTGNGQKRNRECRQLETFIGRSEADIEGTATRTRRLLVNLAGVAVDKLRRDLFFQQVDRFFRIGSATRSFTPPIRLDQNQSMRTMLSSPRKHSIPADSSLPLASIASGKSRKFAMVTSSAGMLLYRTATNH